MAVAAVGSRQPNIGSRVSASATSGDHDLLEASWWKAVREKRANNECLTLALSVAEWCLTLALSVTEWFF